MPGPANHNPFSNIPPARTPGTLGKNDHAETYANGLKNPLVARTSTTIRWSTFLDSLVAWRNVSGPRLAWNSSGHLLMTYRAVGSSVFQDMLPVSDVRERLLWALSGLPQANVWTDITIEQYSDKEHLKKIVSKGGQATHFMAYKGQSQRDAYEWGMEKIFGQIEEAVKVMRQSSNRRGYGDEVITPLAHAVHTIQDSFSPAHVRRHKDGDRWVVAHIFVWSEQRKKDHEEGDETWKIAGEQDSEDVRFSELGNACFEATMMLLKHYVLSVVNKDLEAERQKNELIEKYLAYRPDTLFDDPLPNGRLNLPPTSE